MAKAKKTTKATKKTVAKKQPQKVAKKAAKKTAAKKSEASSESSRGKRYSSKEKAAILLHVENYNAKNGRGGAAVAARKFNITQLTISKWMKEVGSPAPTRKAHSDFNKTIERLTKLHLEMTDLEDKLNSLRKEYLEIRP